MSRTHDHLPPLRRYSAAAEHISAQIIHDYSTSFGLATRLLGPRHRGHVRNIYALVRVADELVDGVSAEAGLTTDEQHDALDGLITETHNALRLGYSSNLVVHAFARTARVAGIDTALITPFFESMRADLPSTDRERGTIVGFDADEHRSYVYGSAEVVGLMCLRVFTREQELDEEQHARLEHGARQLGAAFQNVNFLRDLADDTTRLGRSYLSEHGRITEADRDHWAATIRQQLTDAKMVLPLLPRDARVAVRTALELFAALATRVAATSVEQLYQQRIRISGIAKLGIVIRAFTATWKEPSA